MQLLVLDLFASLIVRIFVIPNSFFIEITLHIGGRPDALEFGEWTKQHVSLLVTSVHKLRILHNMQNRFIMFKKAHMLITGGFVRP